MLLWILLALIVVIAVGLLGLAYVAALRLLSPPRRTDLWKPSESGFRYEDVVIKLRDGTELRGWFIYPNSTSDKTVIVIHGYTASKWDVKPAIEILAKNGFNVLALDVRAHGESGGGITTLGYKEVNDFIEVIDWLFINKPGVASKLGVLGYSMGGAIALMLGAQEGRVKAIVADSPYIDIIASGRRWIMRMKGIARAMLLAVYPLIVYFAAKKANIDVSKLILYNYAKRIDKPTLIIAGKNDDLVSLNEIERFYEELRRRNSNAEIWITDSGHVSAIKDYPAEYERRVISFLTKWLK